MTGCVPSSDSSFSRSSATTVVRANRDEGGVALRSIDEAELSGQFANLKRRDRYPIVGSGVADDAEHAAGNDVQVVVGVTLLNEHLPVGELANRAQRGEHAAFLFVEVRCELRGAQRQQCDFVVHRVGAGSWLFPVGQPDNALPAPSRCGPPNA